MSELFASNIEGTKPGPAGRYDLVIRQPLFLDDIAVSEESPA
jgi:hypothetical protein